VQNTAKYAVDLDLFFLGKRKEGNGREGGRWKVEGGGWMVDRKWWWAEDIKIW
jgi:hypothetical protein